jgi:hypothetical protein
MTGGSAGAKDDQTNAWCYQKLDKDRRAVIARSGYGNYPKVIQALHKEVSDWERDRRPLERMPLLLAFSPKGFQVRSPAHRATLLQFVRPTRADLCHTATK